MFRSVDPLYGPDVVPPTPELYGGWGLVGRRGTVKPAWRAHRFWRELGRDILAFTSMQDAALGVSGVLTRRSPGRYSALASNFDAKDGHRHVLELRLHGVGAGRWTIRVRGVDASDRRTAASSGTDLVVPVELEPQSAVLIELKRVA
jgi:hypothetical protein